MTRNNGSTSTAPKPSCHTCKLVVKDSDQAIQCDLCQFWGHIKCMDIDSDAYDVIQRLDQKFFCANCLPKIDRLLSMERRLDEMEERFSKLEVKLNSSPTTVWGNPHGGMKSFHTDNDAFPVLGDQRPKPFNKQTFEKAVDETVEARLKRHNAVLFGVPESDDDLSAVRNLLKIPSIDNVQSLKPSDVVYVFRDGPIDKDGKWPRFLKVVCTTSKVKQTFITFINRVAKPHMKDLELRARPDLTYQQRVDGRKLRENLLKLGADSHYINYNNRAIVCKTSKNTVFTLDSNNV